MSNDTQTTGTGATGLEPKLSNVSIKGDAPEKGSTSAPEGAPKKRYVPPHLRNQPAGVSPTPPRGGGRGPSTLPPAFSSGRRGYGGADREFSGGGGGRWSGLASSGGFGDRGGRRGDNFGGMWKDGKHIIGPANERLERELFGLPDDGLSLIHI